MGAVGASTDTQTFPLSKLAPNMFCEDYGESAVEKGIRDYFTTLGGTKIGSGGRNCPVVADSWKVQAVWEQLAPPQICRYSQFQI